MQTRREFLSRRRFLGGAGAAVALPFLPSMANATAIDPTRLVVFYVPNGIQMAGWTPEVEGPNWAAERILAPLLDPKRGVDVKDDVTIVSGLRNDPAKPDGPGDHAAGTGSFLTCTHVYKSESIVTNGISMDQVAANAIGQDSRFASMQLGIEGGSNNGGCDSGYSCAYSRNISWAGASTPLNKLTHPRAVFDLMFAGYDPTATAAELDRRRRHKKSVLDYVRADAKRLESKLAADDRRKLDEYVTGLRGLEIAIDSNCPIVERPGETVEYQAHVKTMLDLTVLALKCDLTRVVTFMLNNAGSNRSYPFIGVQGAHHEISHHQDNPEKLADLEKIATWEVEQYAYLLQEMKNVGEGEERNLLDNAMVFFSSEIEDGNSHRHENLPVLLAGKGGGAFRPGRHVRHQDQPIANLFVSMLNGMGVPAQKFADSTGPLVGL
jgi:hypothetical protein